ncbi:MAG: O-linked N-acetylglucosamine transferase, SPINDLY family protein, partial [Planctomycetota bacterium]
GRVREAIATLRHAVELAPQTLGLEVELGRARLEAGDAEGAIEAFERAGDLGGRSPATALELVNALKRRGRVARAIAVADEALARVGDSPLRMARAMLLHDAGRHQEAVVETGAVVTGPDPSPEAISNHLYGLQSPSHLDESEIVAQHRRLGVAMFADEAGATSAGVGVDRDREGLRSLRVGVVSGDLKAHSVAWFLMPLLRGRDPERLHAICYSNTPVEDAVTERLRGASDGWRSILGRSDEAAATAIRDDEIDVLVDLSGHTGGHRLGVFRRRAAPVQATWLGYPNTTGIPEIDWRIVDRLTDPHGTDRFATEALLRMRGPFLCFDREVIEVPIPERPPRPIVFGSFNNTTKLSERCLELWSQVLAAVPDSRLMLKSRSFEDDEFRKATVDRLGRFGIARDRLDLRGFSEGLESHHRAYGEVDVALDTFPCHGTTTTCEALGNGVPVVSRVGDIHRARVGLTLLEAVGLGELACEDDEAFVAAAVALASDRERLHHLHGSLRERMRSSPLCDGRDFAIRFEEAIRHAWRAWCRDETPRSAMLGA